MHVANGEHTTVVKELFTDRLYGSKEDMLSRCCFDTIGPLACEFVLSEQFRISRESDVGKLLLLRFAHEPSTDEILFAFRRRGLIAPQEEDALRFASSLRDDSCDAPVVFLHTDNLWRVPGSREQVCVVELAARRRLYTIWHKNNWGRKYFFAARKSTSQPPN